MRWLTLFAALGCLPALALAEEPANNAGQPNPPVIKLRVHENQDSPQTLVQVEDYDLVTHGPAAAALRARREKGSYLGVSASPPPPVLRKQLGLHEGMGLVVDLVVPESPAAKAGLREFDVLEKLDDQLLVNPEQFAVLVRSHKPGDEVKLGIIRESKATTLTAKLAEHELEPLGANENLIYFEKALPEPPALKPIAPGAWWSWDVARPGMASSSVTWLEGDRSYTVVTNPARQRTFTVKGTDGKVIFEGPINTKEEREKVPADLRAKLDKLMHNVPGASPNVRPTTGPAK